MKAISLILGLLLASNSAFAGLPPTTAKGQQDTSAITTFNFQTPNKLATKVAGATLIESGNKNILQNPSFEATPNPNHPGWVQTGIVSPNVETSVVIDGKQSVKLNSPNQTLDFHADSTLYAAQFADGVQGLAMIRAKTTTTDTPIYVCPRTAGAYPTTKTSGCVQIQPTGKWGLYKVPFVLGGTSNGIGITSNGVATTGDVYIDDAFVGAVDLKVDTNIITPWQTYTPTYVGFGTVTVSEIEWRQVGSSIELRGSFTSATPSAVAATISLPNNYTVKSSTSNVQMAGRWSRDHAVSSTIKDGPFRADNGANFLYFAWDNYNSATPFNSAKNGDAIVISGNRVSIIASVPVNELKGAASTYSSSCGANCVDTFSASVSSAGVVSGENIDWITGNTSVANTAEYTFTFTSPFTVAPNCVATSANYPSTTNNPIVASIDSVTSTSARVTMKQTSVFTAVGFTIFCQKTGSDFIATRTLQGFFNEVMATPGQSKVKEITMTYGNSTGSSSAPVVCSSTPCSIYTNSSGSFSSLTWASTGVMQVTVANGTFAANSEYECQCKGYVSGSGVNCVSYANGNQTILTNSSGGLIMGINSTSMAGTAANSFGIIKCRGIAP